MLQRTVQALRMSPACSNASSAVSSPISDAPRSPAIDARTDRTWCTSATACRSISDRSPASSPIDLHDLVGDGVAAAEHQIVRAPAQADDLRAARAEVGSDAADLADLRLDLVELAQLGGGHHRLALRAQPDRASRRQAAGGLERAVLGHAPARRARRGPRPGSGAARPPARRRRRLRCRARRARSPRPDRWRSARARPRAGTRRPSGSARRRGGSARPAPWRRSSPSAPATRPPAGGRARGPRRSASRTRPRAPARGRRSARRRCRCGAAIGMRATSSRAHSRSIQSPTRAPAPSPPSRNVTPVREKRSPKTLAARSTRRASGSSASRRACTMPITESGSDSLRPSAAARISSSR